ncbi:MAG: tetratricopeptide repeat protein, partial [Myxococcota bacterium]
FLQAADEYKKVRDSNADDKFQENSAFSVVLAYERAVQLKEKQGELEPALVRKSTDRSPEEDLSPKEIPEIKLSLVAASDRYAVVAPNSDKVPKVLYKAAEIYYTYDHFDEARRRFESLIGGFSQDEVAEYASNLVIESYLTEGKYDEVEKFTRTLLASGSPGRRNDFKDDLVKFKSGAMFKIADELAASGQYEKAAETYLSLLDENPENEFADSALNNAAVAYEKVQRYDSASRLYESLVKQHPKSPLADNALFRVGLNAERFFDLEKATQNYLELIKKYPKSTRRADAIYNAALALENTQRYDEAATQYQRYCKLFPDRDDAPQVCFRAGAVYEKMGEPRKVITTYNTFIRKYKKNPTHADRIVEAYLKLAKASSEVRKEREARKAYRDAVAVYQKSKNPAATPFAAEAQFQLVELEYEKFKKVQITGNTKQQKRGIEKKAKMLKEIESSYGKILGFKQVDWTMASLYRVGNLYQNFADSIIQAPCPKEIKAQARSLGMTKEEVCDEYRILLEEQSFTIEDKAVAAYETTITKARELQVKNDWTKKTLVALNKLRRAQWPLQKDAKLFVDSEPVASPPMLSPDGSGLFLA